jgi:hypothetical protein
MVDRESSSSTLRRHSQLNTSVLRHGSSNSTMRQRHGSSSSSSNSTMRQRHGSSSSSSSNSSSSSSSSSRGCSHHHHYSHHHRRRHHHSRLHHHHHRHRLHCRPHHRCSHHYHPPSHRRPPSRTRRRRPPRSRRRRPPRTRRSRPQTCRRRPRTRRRLPTRRHRRPPMRAVCALSSAHCRHHLRLLAAGSRRPPGGAGSTPQGSDSTLPACCAHAVAVSRTPQPRRARSVLGAPTRVGWRRSTTSRESTWRSATGWKCAASNTSSTCTTPPCVALGVRHRGWWSVRASMQCTVPSHPVPSRPVPSRPIRSDPIRSDPTSSHPIPPHRKQVPLTHPIPPPSTPLRVVGMPWTARAASTCSSRRSTASCEISSRWPSSSASARRRWRRRARSGSHGGLQVRTACPTALNVVAVGADGVCSVARARAPRVATPAAFEHACAASVCWCAARAAV